MEIIKANYFVFKDKFKSIQSPERVVENYEFELYIKGEGYSVIDGVKYPYTPGALVLARPGTKRYSYGGFECFCIHFMPEKNDEIIDIIDRFPAWYKPQNLREIEKIFGNCESRGAFTKNDRMYISGAVLQLVAVLNDMIYPFGENKTSKHSRYLSEIVKAKTYLETNYGTKITLPTVAAEVNLSPNFFRIVFKELVGRSPHEYLLEIRIRKAEAYLENTDFPINQIADLCGFETQSYMNYVFSKYCGVSPYKYRSMHHK